MRISKKILACVLAALMALTMMPFTVLAATVEVNSIETLEAALASAQSGDTVKLTADIDYSTVYTVRNARDNDNEHIVDLKDCTLDLNGHTISTINATVEFCGNGATIENGTFDLVHKSTAGTYQAGSYALIIDNDGQYPATAKVTVNDVVCNGAVNVCAATVELNNVTACTTPTKFYTVWAEQNAKVTINSGTYTDEQSKGKGVFATGTGEEGGATIDVKGGTFNASNKVVYNAEANSINISGGFVSKDPAGYLAEGCTWNSETHEVTQTSVAKIGSTLYATLEEAIAAANAGDTVTLIADVDLTAYARSEAHKINLSGMVLDLDGHTISNKNKGVVFVGDNFTVKNGNMVCVNDPSFTSYTPDNSYGIMIWPEDGDDVHDTVADPSENVVLENLNVTGGINCFGANVTIKGENTNVAGTAYYAVWANAYTTINIEDGTFTTTANRTTSTIGAGVETGKGAINVKGGNFTVESGKVLVHDNTSKGRVIISGGSYHYANGNVYTVPAINVATNYTQDMTSGEVIPDAVDTMSITVEDDIDLNIYLDDSTAVEDYYKIDRVVYSYNSTPDIEEEHRVTVETPAKRNKDGKVVLSIELAPAQIRDDITVEAYSEGNTQVRNFTTSIADYCNTIIEGQFPENLKNLAKSTLDYGKGASNYFGYNTYEYSGYTIQLSDPTEEIAAVAATAAANKLDTEGLFTVTGVSYRATSKPEIRFYIDPTSVHEDYLSSLNQYVVSSIGKAYFAKQDDKFMLVIKNLDIVDFGKQFVVTIKDSHDSTYDRDIIEFTPITWVKAAIKSSDNNLKGLAKTIGNYYLKSVAYFGA